MNALIEYIREQAKKLEEVASQAETSATRDEARQIARDMQFHLKDYVDAAWKRYLKEPEQMAEFLRLYPTFEVWCEEAENHLVGRTTLFLDSDDVGWDEDDIKQFYSDGVCPLDAVLELIEDNDLIDYSNGW